MARYRVNTPNFENPAAKRAKREAKKKYIIFRTVSIIYSIILIACIIIGGLNRNNSLIYGWTYVALGFVSLVLTVFMIYTIAKGWSKKYYYWKEYETSPVLMESKDGKEIFKEEMAEHIFIEIFTAVLYLGLTVAVFVMGIRALISIV